MYLHSKFLLCSDLPFQVPFSSSTHYSPAPLPFTKPPEALVLNAKACQEPRPPWVRAQLQLLEVSPHLRVRRLSCSCLLGLLCVCALCATESDGEDERWPGGLSHLGCQVHCPAVYSTMAEGSKNLSSSSSASCSQFRPAPEQLLYTARSKLRHRQILSHCKCASPYGFVKTMLWDPKPAIHCPDPGNCNMERHYPLRLKKSTKYFIYMTLLRIGRDVWTVVVLF